jgi:ABC-type transport system involved in multi-copper enzyme maturation permease subunit
MIKDLYSFIRKDSKEIYKSFSFFMLIVLWLFITVAMAIDILYKGSSITNYNLIDYHYIKSIILVSVFFYFVPAIIISMDFENKMIYIFKNLRIKFSHFFISKLFSILIVYLFMTLISIISFIIIYTIFYYNDLNKMFNIVIPLMAAYLPLLLILMPITSLMVLLSYILVKRSDIAIIAVFLFIILLYFVEPLSVGYYSRYHIGYTAYYIIPYILYPLFAITPQVISGFIGEAIGLPDENVVIKHTGNATRISTASPDFTSFLHFYGYIELFLIISLIFIVMAYLIGRWRFNNE